MRHLRLFIPTTSYTKHALRSVHITHVSTVPLRSPRKPPPMYNSVPVPFPATHRPREYTIENLKTWSCVAERALPEREAVRAIHIYDFDNTLFLTPMPNSKIWYGPTLINLGSPTWLVNGGWWHDPRILAATGEGLEKEEARAWEGWWNEHIVQLVKLSMQQKDALTVLLTGRSVKDYSSLIQRIVKSKGLDFDMTVLKPQTMPSGDETSTTIAFKCVFLEELLNTYKEAQELRCAILFFGCIVLNR